jgi:hypothetical protein
LFFHQLLAPNLDSVSALLMPNVAVEVSDAASAGAAYCSQAGCRRRPGEGELGFGSALEIMWVGDVRRMNRQLDDNVARRRGATFSGANELPCAPPGSLLDLA